MPGTFQVSVLGLMDLPSSVSSRPSLHLSIGKIEYQIMDTGEFSFRLMSLRDDLIVSLRNEEGSEISRIVIETKMVVEKGVLDDVFSFNGSGKLHLKLQFVLSEDEKRRIQDMRESALKKKQGNKVKRSLTSLEAANDAEPPNVPAPRRIKTVKRSSSSPNFRVKEKTILSKGGTAYKRTNKICVSRATDDSELATSTAKVPENGIRPLDFSDVKLKATFESQQKTYDSIKLPPPVKESDPSISSAKEESKSTESKVKSSTTARQSSVKNIISAFEVNQPRGVKDKDNSNKSKLSMKEGSSFRHNVLVHASASKEKEDMNTKIGGFQRVEDTKHIFKRLKPFFAEKAELEKSQLIPNLVLTNVKEQLGGQGEKRSLTGEELSMDGARNNTLLMKSEVGPATKEKLSPSRVLMLREENVTTIGSSDKGLYHSEEETKQDRGLLSLPRKDRSAVQEVKKSDVSSSTELKVDSQGRGRSPSSGEQSIDGVKKNSLLTKVGVGDATKEDLSPSKRALLSEGDATESRSSNISLPYQSLNQEESIKEKGLVPLPEKGFTSSTSEINVDIGQGNEKMLNSEKVLIGGVRKNSMLKNDEIGDATRKEFFPSNRRLLGEGEATEPKSSDEGLPFQSSNQEESEEDRGLLSLPNKDLTFVLERVKKSEDVISSTCEGKIDIGQTREMNQITEELFNDGAKKSTKLITIEVGHATMEEPCSSKSTLIEEETVTECGSSDKGLPYQEEEPEEDRGWLLSQEKVLNPIVKEIKRSIEATSSTCEIEEEEMSTKHKGSIAMLEASTSSRDDNIDQENTDDNNLNFQTQNREQNLTCQQVSTLLFFEDFNELFIQDEARHICLTSLTKRVRKFIDGSFLILEAEAKEDLLSLQEKPTLTYQATRNDFSPETNFNQPKVRRSKESSADIGRLLERALNVALIVVCGSLFISTARRKTR